MSNLSDSAISNPFLQARRLFQAVSNGQRAYLLISLSFIAAGIFVLPEAALLTASSVNKLFMFLALSLTYGLFGHVIAHFAVSRSLDSSIEHGFRCILTRENLLRAVPTVFVIGGCTLTFLGFKSQIPVLNPYSWDPALASLDRMIHLGTDPWRLIADVFGYGWFTVQIDYVYYLWFPVTFAFPAIAALAPGNGVLRQRFLLSFGLSWIVIGCLFATGLASVGPIFYDRIAGGLSGFTALTAQLEAVNQVSPLQTLEVREILWRSYIGASDLLVGGISAMPSMHNAICVLLFLAARHISRLLAAVAAVYALVIFIGSVHLGWHYAVDAYAAAVLTAVIWKAAGLVANKEAAWPQTA
jgi:PAP2 superfamily